MRMRREAEQRHRHNVFKSKHRTQIRLRVTDVETDISVQKTSQADTGVWTVAGSRVRLLGEGGCGPDQMLTVEASH